MIRKQVRVLVSYQPEMPLQRRALRKCQRSETLVTRAFAVEFGGQWRSMNVLVLCVSGGAAAGAAKVDRVEARFEGIVLCGLFVRERFESEASAGRCSSESISRGQPV